MSNHDVSTMERTASASSGRFSSPIHGVHSGIPTYFRAWCSEAARGGSGGYQDVGYQLAGVIGREIPYDVDENEWADEAECLYQALDDDDRHAVLGWFCRHYPRMMKLIPVRRRMQFVAGVERADEEGKTEM